jgi:hypothetical protein
MLIGWLGLLQCFHILNQIVFGVLVRALNDVLGHTPLLTPLRFNKEIVLDSTPAPCYTENARALRDKRSALR